MPKIRIRDRKIYTYKLSDGTIVWIKKVYRRSSLDTSLYVDIYFPYTDNYMCVPYKKLLSGNIKDRSINTIFDGLAKLGNDYDRYMSIDKELTTVLYKRWKFMIYRCYKTDHKSAKSYSEKGVTVCDRWLNFSNFCYDAERLPGYTRQGVISGELTLDKDSKQTHIYENRVYSQDTCVWLTRTEQQRYIDHYTPQKKLKLQVIHPDGRVTVEEGLNKISKKYNVDMKCIHRVLNGKQKSTKGYKFERMD